MCNAILFSTVQHYYNFIHTDRRPESSIRASDLVIQLR